MKQIKYYLSKYRSDFPVFFLILFSTPLFLFKLGQSSLVSWDEAWYAEISRNILKTGNLFSLVWNGKPYYDHPPLGFWLTAISFKLFGVNEFWARFPQALAGILSIIAVYFLGRELFSRRVGFAAALALPSCYWFLTRSRSDNLDALLTLLFITTMLFAVKAIKKKRFFIPFALSFSGLLLTKSLVPLTIVPSLLIIFWGYYKNNCKYFLFSLVIITLFSGSWFLYQVLGQEDYLGRYLSIGFPNARIANDYMGNLLTVKQFLHQGIGKWFWPGVISAALGLITLKRNFLVISSFVVVFLLPFAFSPKSEIWHLIPLYPFLTLVFAGLSELVLLKLVRNSILVTSIMVLVFGYTAFIQLKRSWYQFIDIPAFVTDEAILSREAGKYGSDLYIDDDYLPAAVFYSEKKVKKVVDDKEMNEFRKTFAKPDKIQLITKQYRMDNSGIARDGYFIIKTDRDKILVSEK